MASTKISQLTALETLSDNDLLVVVDVSDTTMGPGGTNKKILASNVAAAVSPDLHRKTPAEFGAVGDGVTDDTDAMEDYFLDSRDPENCIANVYDWSEGEYLISRTLYIAHPQTDANQPTLKMIGGRLRVAPVASLPGGVPLAVVLDIAGPRQQWAGRIEVNNAGSPEWSRFYNDKRYYTGVRIRCCISSNFPDIYVDDAMRDGILLDSRDNSGFTLDGVVYTQSNCIGTTFGAVICRNCGSGHRSNPNFGTRTTISDKKYGTFTSGSPYYPNEVFTESGLGANEIAQRTQLVVASTAEMEINDMIQTRFELGPAIYGTIAYDNGASTIVWTASDPTDYLNVGDLYPVSFFGANAGVEFTVVSFGGTSNRTITVTPAPTTMAATADSNYAQNGEYTFHAVSNVTDATHVSVFPWVPTRNNSDALIVHGAAVRIEGADTANVIFESVRHVVGGIGLDVNSLYSPLIGTLLSEGLSIGLRLALPGSNQTIGLNITHGHIEGCTSEIMMQGTVYGQANLQSGLNIEKCGFQYVRASHNSQSMTVDEQNLSFLYTWDAGKPVLPSPSYVASIRFPPGIDPAVTIKSGDAWGHSTLGFSYRVGSKTVRLGYDTGWAAATGVATKTTFDTATVTTAQLAERVKALTDYLITQGMLTS